MNYLCYILYYNPVHHHHHQQPPLWFTVPKMNLYNTSAELRRPILHTRVEGCRMRDAHWKNHICTSTHVSPFGQVSSHAMSVACDDFSSFTSPTRIRAIDIRFSNVTKILFSIIISARGVKTNNDGINELSEVILSCKVYKKN